MSGITIPRRISTPLLSLLNYRRNYGVCIVKRGCPAQCRHARESRTDREKYARDQRVSSPWTRNESSLLSLVLPPARARASCTFYGHP